MKRIYFIITISTLFLYAEVKATDDKIKENKKSYLEVDSLLLFEHPQIDVIGRREDALRMFPGSAELISEKQLSLFNPLSGNEAIKKVNGIYVSDEEGLGMRMNLGIRGLDPDRSRTIHVMEDGVPLSLAPYGEPEMYYTPSIERISNIEILKGSGSILFGPQTIGGVLNYITFDPPTEQRTRFNLKSGSGGLMSGVLSYGTTLKDIGFNINLLHKQADKIGVTNFNVNDITAKINIALNSNSKIGIKFSAYDETSNSTYIGITQTMFDRGEYFVNLAPYDNLSVRRYSLNLSHHYLINPNFILKTTAFGYTTTRNWLRQDFSRAPHSNQTGVIWGDTTVAKGAIYMRNSTGNRNRQFEVMGFEPRFVASYELGGLKNELDGGVRFLYERAFEQSVNGKKYDAKSGDLVLDEIRTGFGSSLYLQNKLHLSSQLSLSPGLRFEKFSFERRINRISSTDTLLIGNDDLTEVIPALGFTFGLENNFTVFGGIHKGFAPPRIKDAIDNSGESLKLEAERSWNIELGIRTLFANAIKFEATVYRLDFSNQIIPVSLSSGGSGTGLVNGGKTLHQGVELALGLNFNSIFDSEVKVNYLSNLTLSSSKFSAVRFVSGKNVEGNKLPYAPSFIMNNTLELGYKNILFSICANSIGEHFSDELNTVSPSADGQTGKINSYTTLDFSARYSLEAINGNVFISVKNLLDERYIASRRPQGIKVGIPRQIIAGVDLSL